MLGVVTEHPARLTKEFFVLVQLFYSTVGWWMSVARAILLSCLFTSHLSLLCLLCQYLDNSLCMSF